LAVGAADADAAVKPAGHQPQQVGALNGGHAAGPRRHQLGVVVHDSGGVDNQVCALDVLGALADGNRDAKLLPLKVDGVAGVIVRAGDVVSHAVQDLHQWKHARAADADEV